MSNTIEPILPPTRKQLRQLVATGSHLGSDELGDQYFGGPLPDAESQAMKRAAARFGLGLYLYDKAIINSLKRRL